MQRIINYIKKNLLFIVFFALLILLLIYISSSYVRCILRTLNIDPNFIVVFITALTLIFSAIENKKERKYNFNLSLKRSIEDKAMLVIGKLFVIMNDSKIYLNTIKGIKDAVEGGKKFVDANNILSNMDLFKKDREFIGAYITTYFSPYIFDDWNSMGDKISEIWTNCLVVLGNYNEDFNLINTEGLKKQEFLAKIKIALENSTVLNNEIYNLTEKMKNKLLSIIKENDDKMREKYVN